MLDVTDNAWCWDGTSKYFGKFEDKVAERFLAKSGGRTALGWYLAGDAALTVESLDLFCSRLWSMKRLEIGIDKADRDAASEAFWALEYAESWKQLQGDTFYAWLTYDTHLPLVTLFQSPRRWAERIFGIFEKIFTRTMALVLRRISKEWRKSLTKLSTEASL